MRPTCRCRYCAADPAPSSLDRLAAVMTELAGDDPQRHRIERLQAMRRRFHDLRAEIAEEKAAGVVDLAFVKVLEERKRELLGELARLYALIGRDI